MPGRFHKFFLFITGYSAFEIITGYGALDKCKKYVYNIHSNVFMFLTKMITDQAKITIKDELRKEALFQTANSNLLRLLKKDLEEINRKNQIIGLILWTINHEDTKNSLKKLMRKSFRQLFISSDTDGKELYKRHKFKFNKKIKDKIMKMRKDQGKLNELEILIDKVKNV
ncbi:hypothetical protein SteCoe_30154 [Stentor coeruleus]|uniref:Uncharacterized protein n=1 Tax=Stentor coeruleus TaxID=5963 RepID=A0A1R2B474_9CILI|nr:hypothetical protein SteCoe_30154 [Stentor coeruleus]